MRVVHVVESLSPAWGGVSRAVAGMSAAMVRHGLEVEVITTAWKDNGQLWPEGAVVNAFRPGPLAWWGFARDMGAAIRRATALADIVHLHGLWHYPQVAASRAALRVQRPYLVSPHGMLDGWALGYKRSRKHLYASLVEWRTLRRAAAIHAVSESEATSVRRLHLNPAVVVVPNGIDASEFGHLPARSALSLRYPAFAGKTILLFLGRLHPIKGLDILAEAFCRVAKVRDDLVLVIAGPDETGERKKIEARLVGGGARGRYVFTGMLRGAERLAALAGAHLFVLPSYSEGLSVAALEAMASGLPVVLSEASDIPGVKEAGAGFVVPPQVGALGLAIRRLVDDPDLREAMGRRGRHLVLTNYAWDRAAAQMMDVYNGILAGGVHERLQHARA